ncbi:MAG: SoxR reducing system RseC family protein [Halioglobus sp.]
MLTETGRVVAVETESIWVETVRQSTCGSCAARKGCGHGIMNRYTDGRQAYIRVLPGERGLQDCRVDDQVRFAIPEDVLLRGSFIAYLLPLLSMIGGAVGLNWLYPAQGDVSAAVGAVAGLAAGFAVVRWHARRHHEDPDFQPVLLEVLTSRGVPVHVA